MRSGSVSAAVDGPLVSTSERFALGRSRRDQSAAEEVPSPVGVRPFGLRFAVAPTGAAEALPPWRYCPQRQIGIGADGEPWYRGIVDMTMKTTGPSPDGGGNTGGEEWGPDFVPDQPI